MKEWKSYWLRGEVNLKKENIYILCRKEHKNYKRKIMARTFIQEGIKFALIGNSHEGYNLTMCENGMSVFYANKLKDIMAEMEKIIQIIKESKPYFFESAKKMFDEAEIMKEGEGNVWSNLFNGRNHS